MGKFITFEGIEGTGKTINMAFVKNFFDEKGYNAVISREPGGTKLSEEIRNVLTAHREENVSGEVELLLFFAARRHHLENVILRSVKQGKFVLCDRFTDSSYAYQGAGRGIAYKKIDLLKNFVQDKFNPDLTFILDVPVEIGLKRARNRGELDRVETEEKSFFERVRSAYLEMGKVNPSKYIIIDTLNPLEKVQQLIKSNLEKFLNTWSVQN